VGNLKERQLERPRYRENNNIKRTLRNTILYYTILNYHNLRKHTSNKGSVPGSSHLRVERNLKELVDRICSTWHKPSSDTAKDNCCWTEWTWSQCIACHSCHYYQSCKSATVCKVLMLSYTHNKWLSQSVRSLRAWKIQTLSCGLVSRNSQQIIQATGYKHHTL
jgi:hypothetical protein